MTEAECSEPRFMTVKDYAEGLEPVYMQPVRLLIATMLADRQWRDLATIREALSLRSLTLSRQLKPLSLAGFVESCREGPHSQWRITHLGHDRLIDHLEALRGVMALAGDIVLATHAG